MGIAFGSTGITAIYRGSSAASAVYRGTASVWTPGPPPYDRAGLISALQTRVAADGGTFESASLAIAALTGITDAQLTAAKLVLTPSAWKSGKVYSAIGPDFTVSRATGRSRIRSDLALEYLANNVPGIDYAAGATAPAVLVEPQRTNLFTDVLDFSAGTWQRLRVTVATDATAAPDGTTTADRLQEDTTNNSHLVVQTRSHSSGLTYSASGFAKKGIGSAAPSVIQMLMSTAAFGSSQYASYNLDANTATAFGGASAALTALANGWKRASITATATSTSGGSNQTLFAFCNNSTGTRLPGYTGSPNADIYAWGAQLEIGAPTSFIPHTNSGGIRDADVISVPVPVGTTQIIQTVDGVTTTITSIPATYTLPIGRVERVLML